MPNTYRKSVDYDEVGVTNSLGIRVEDVVALADELRNHPRYNHNQNTTIEVTLDSAGDVRTMKANIS